MTDFDERINDIEKRLIALETGFIQRIGHLGETLHVLQGENNDLRKCNLPHVCPICSGRGSPFIQSDTCAAAPRKHWIETNPCIACEGKGIVWR